MRLWSPRSKIASSLVLRDFVQEARAARAQDASLLIQHHVRADIDRLALLDFLAQRKARLLAVVIHVVVLQFALARLIAHRTIDRMVDQQELQHRALRRLGLIAVGMNHHPFGDLGVAGDLQLGRLLDLDQAHPAIADDGERRMVTVMRDFHPEHVSRLDYINPLGSVEFFTVDGYLGHVVARYDQAAHRAREDMNVSGLGSCAGPGRQDAAAQRARFAGRERDSAFV